MRTCPDIQVTKVGQFTPHKSHNATWWPNETVENGSRSKLKLTYQVNAT